MKPITLGSDPEVHLFDNQEGRVVSSLRVLGTDKHNPISLGAGVRMYADNALTEVSFPPAGDTPQIMERMGDVFQRAQNRLGTRYTMLPEAAVLYPMTELDHKSLWESGCNPNKDVYARVENKPADFRDGLRTGSFHIHVGHEDVCDIESQEMMVKLMDVFVGCASIIFDKDPSAPKRRALYGRAGEFRCTSYGIEYRCLGNWSLKSFTCTELVWDLVQHAVHHFEIGDGPSIIEACGSFRVQAAINGNDRELAKEVLEVAALPYKLMDRVQRDLGTPDFKTSWGL